MPSVGVAGGANGVSGAGTGSAVGPGGAVVVVVVGAVDVVDFATRPAWPVAAVPEGDPLLHAASSTAAPTSPAAPISLAWRTPPTGVSVRCRPRSSGSATPDPRPYARAPWRLPWVTTGSSL